MFKLRRIKRRGQPRGFTLTELLVAIAIIGTLSSIALPNYLGQMQRTRQSEAASTISQLQNTLVAYVDEYRAEPTGWDDLSDISVVMTSTGIANGENFDAITLPGENYLVTISGKDGQYTFEAATDSSNRNIMACIDLNNGASDLKKGDASNPVTTEDLVCWESE